jgi:ribosome-associated toxin RatA of RatAB toxin-antitoxin module
MREVIRSALVANSAAQLYALIVDVDRYPQFLPWCVASRIEQRTADSMVASLSIRRGPLRAEFTTRNALTLDRTVGMTLVSGPFRSLEGLWTLTPLGEDGCRVERRMRFEFANRVSAALLEPVFDETAASLVDAFVVRAREVYRG